MTGSAGKIGSLSFDAKAQRNNSDVYIMIELIILALALSMDAVAVVGRRCAHFDWL